MADSFDSFDNYTAPNQGDAWAYLQSVLSYYGLGDLNDFAHNAIVQGLSNTQIVQGLRQTDTYKQRFQAIVQLQEKGLPPISEQDVLNLESQYSSIRQAAGFPQGFHDSPEDDAANIVNGISPTEYQDRVVKGFQAVSAAPQETKDFLTSQFGMNQGDMVAYFLDPDKTEDVLMRRVTAAQIGGAAARTGFGNVSGDQAMHLQSLGVTGDQAQQGFSQLANERELMNTLPGEAGNNISDEEQLAAQFGGDAEAQQKVKARQAQRLASFQGGGQFASDKEGFAGTGTSR